MMNRLAFTGLILVVSSSVFADPIDTAYDLIDAVTYQDGNAVRNLLSEDLWLTISSFMDQMRELAAADPVLAADILLSRYRGRITVEDLEFLSNEDLLGRVMSEVRLQPEDQIESESAMLEGRNASVVLNYFNGGSLSFRMTWENSSWKIADTSLLGTLFN